MRMLFFTICLLASVAAFSQNQTYYVDNVLGKDADPGTAGKPWKTVTPANKFNFEPGDQLLFTGGQIFGQLQLQANDAGLTIKSTNGKAVLGGLYAYNVGNITIDGIDFKGPGATGNNIDGIKFYMDGGAPGDLASISINNVSVSNFGSNGILFGAWSTNNGYNNINVQNSNLFQNGVDGMATYGYYDYINHTQLYIKNVKAYQNYGRTDITSNHTGSGFTIGGIDGGMIEYCEAYQNGKNNRFYGGGPQGFWCYNSKNVTFQYSTSHDNKAGNRFDGGGFDIDGGSQNCVIQYCYSYNNDGPGFAFFEHGSTNQFTNNTIRYNISQNDARANAHGSIMLWAQDTVNRVKNSFIHNNTVYVTPSAIATATYPAGLFFKWSNFQNLSVFNNVFYTTDTIRTVIGSTTGVTFSNNAYWTQNGTVSSKKGGVAVDPQFKNPGGGKDGYMLKATSPLINAGKTSGVAQDFVGTPVPSGGGYDIGAYEANYKPPVSNAGSDQTIVLPTNSVTLNGSGTDADGSIVKYAWTKISGPSTFTIGAGSAASTSVTNLVQGSYTFRLTVTDNDGATAFDDAVVVVNAAPSADGSKLVKVNVYGGTAPYANSEWNNWNIKSSMTSSALKYSDMSASTITTTLSASSAVSDNGTSYGGTMAPPEVLRFCSAANVARTLTFNGLSATKTYTLYFYASKASTGYSTVFTIGSTSVTVKTDYNLSTVAQFTNLKPNASGQIVVNIKSTTTYNFLNGFMLKELNATTTAINSDIWNSNVAESEALQVHTGANPAPDFFRLHISSHSHAPVTVQITDGLGRSVEARNKVVANSTVTFGHTFQPGIYFARVVQGQQKVTVKLVKTKVD